MDWQHIIPVDDLKEHTTIGGCECDPKIDWEVMIVIHNSYDHREVVERANEIVGQQLPPIPEQGE